MTTGSRASSPADRSFGAAEDVSDPNPDINKYTEVAVAPDSTVTVLWRENGDTEPVTAAATKTPDAGFAELHVLSQTGVDSYTPLLTVDPDGKATASWLFYDGADTIVQPASTETPNYNISLTRKGGGEDKMTSSPSGISCGDDCSGDFTSLSTVTLTAEPDPDNRFTGWTGPCTGSALTCEVFMDRDRTPSATFCPAKSLKLGKLTRKEKNGTAKQAATAGGSGTIVLKSSKKVKKNNRKVGAGGLAIRRRPSVFLPSFPS